MPNNPSKLLSREIRELWITGFWSPARGDTPNMHTEEVCSTAASKAAVSHLPTYRGDVHTTKPFWRGGHDKHNIN